MRPAAVSIDEIYRDFAPLVRRQLFILGVRTADLPDMCQEVFVVLNQNSERIAEIARIDLWLREVCRRVASGYRRRPQNAREVLMTDSDLSAKLNVRDPADTNDSSSCLEDDDRLSLALDRLDDESKDLLALHDAGDLPLTDLAKLVEHDRKTVRKRLELARRRLSRLLDEEGMSTPQPDDEAIVGRAPTGRPNYAPDLQVVAVAPNLTMGLFGNVAIAVWPGMVDLESIELLASNGPKLIEQCSGKVVYLSVVESTIRPPPFSARQRIVEALNEFGHHVLSYATILLGGTAWIARPIMSGLVVLSRPRIPMRFFSSMPAGCDWLCTHHARSVDGPMSSATLADAAQRLRSIRSR
jgi:RNA polymerase sigma factor (sigma-70 family)